MSVYYGEFVCPNGHAHKPAQSVVSEPDEAAVQAVADAIAAHFFPRWGWSEMRESFQVGYRKLASAVLATPVVADAFAAVEFREKVAEILADNPRQPAYAVRRIAALLAGES